MKNRISLEERLRILDVGGSWFAEDIKTSFDSYEKMKRIYAGPYRYLCSVDVKIEDPEKYDFFNPEIKRGYILPRGCWYSPSANTSYDDFEECTKLHDDCKCICKDDYEKAFKLQGVVPNKKSEVARKRKRDKKGHFI